MTLSTHAAAAKAIRQELKKHGIKGRVIASSYSGGSSITVSTENLPPWVMKELTAFANQFQYGYFDGMTDSYVYSNISELPQVTYVFVENSFSDTAKESAYSYLINNWGGFEDYPETFAEAVAIHGYDIRDEIHQILTGASDSCCSTGCTKYWNKPRVRLAA